MAMKATSHKKDQLRTDFAQPSQTPLLRGEAASIKGLRLVASTSPSKSKNTTPREGVITSQAAIESFLNDRLLRNYSQQTLYDNYKSLRLFMAWLPKELRQDLRGITSTHIDDYQHHVKCQHNKLCTQQIKIQTVKKLFDYLVDDNQLLIHPAEHIVLEKRPRDELHDILTEADVIQLLDAVDLKNRLGLRDRAWLEFMYSTALRVGECEKLLLDDIDFVLHEVRVLGKGNKERLVPVGQMAMGWLKRYLNESRHVLLKDPSSLYVFVGRSGQPLIQTQMRCILRKYQEQTGSKKSMSPHSLRHACATHLLRAGADIRDIQKFLGHASIDSTMIYLNLMSVDIKNMHNNHHPWEINDVD